MVVYRAGRKTRTDLYGPRVMRRRVTGGGHVTRRDAERVRDETLGIGPGLSGYRDGVGTGVERVITVSPPQGHALRPGRAGPCLSLGV